MKAAIICNPAAGPHSVLEELGDVAEFLTREGWELTGIDEMHNPGDTTAYARAAVARGCDAIFVAGGDGTIAQAVDGLVGTETTLAVLPAGTGNVFARQLNLPLPGGLHPRPMVESARLLTQGQLRRVDVGRISPLRGRKWCRHFLCWGGIGFDAEVNRVVAADLQLKKRLGIAAFFLAGFLTLRNFAGTAANVRIDGHRVSRRMIMLVANNIQLYGVFVRMTPSAVLDDGWLNVACFQGTSPARTALHAVRVMLGQHIHDPKVEFYRARRIEVSTYRPLPVHVDGDAVGYTPVVIEVVPHALKLMTPTCAPASLFVNSNGLLADETAWEWMMRMVKDAQTALKERSEIA